MRDLDRVRDKIEVRLEPRQVVLLAVGTMLFSGLLFAAGFMLGRSRAPTPAPAPLAIGTVASEAIEAADTAPARPAAIGEVTFEFPSMLGSRPGREVTRRRPMRLSRGVVPVAGAKAEAPAEEAEAPAEPEPTPEIARIEPPAPKAPIDPPAPAAAPPAPEPIAARPTIAPIPADPEPIDEDDPDAAPPPAPPPTAAPEPIRPPEPSRPPEPVADARYTLQVKAARDKAEADAFVAELREAGFAPHVVLADIPGKGRFFRIRVGHFGSMAEARAFQRRYKRQSGQPDGGFVTDL